MFEELLTAKIEGAIASGTYDLGVETLTAESLAVTARRTIYVHPATGAETQVFTVARRDRNKPLALIDALAIAVDPRTRLLLNARSGRAAVQMPTPSLMLDDGEIERRVRLIRPMERGSIALHALDDSQWHEAGREAFATAWNEEVAAVPEFATSTFHIVTGLLLPIWRRLPQDGSRVYRLQTDAGERVIGRLVSPAWIAQSVDTEVPSLSPDDAWNALLDGKTGLELADGLELRRVTVMHEHRVELAGFTDGMVDRLKAMGLTSEIISWRLRLFVPVAATGPTILAALMERHPLARIVERGA